MRLGSVLVTILMLAWGCTMPTGSSSDESAAGGGKADGWDFGGKRAVEHPIELDGQPIEVTIESNPETEHGYTFELDAPATIAADLQDPGVDHHWFTAALDEFGIIGEEKPGPFHVERRQARLALFEWDTNEEEWDLLDEYAMSGSLHREVHEPGRFMLLPFTNEREVEPTPYHLMVSKNEDLEARAPGHLLVGAFREDGGAAEGLRIAIGTSQQVVDHMGGAEFPNIPAGIYRIKLGPNGEGTLPTRGGPQLVTVHGNDRAQPLFFHISEENYEQWAADEEAERTPAE